MVFHLFSFERYFNLAKSSLSLPAQHRTREFILRNHVFLVIVLATAFLVFPNDTAFAQTEYAQATIANVGGGSLAVDASGNVYVGSAIYVGVGSADRTNVIKLTPSPRRYVQSPLPIPGGTVAVDGNDNLYVATLNAQRYIEVYKETLSNGDYTQNTIISPGFGLEHNGSEYPGLGVDSVGDIYYSGAYVYRDDSYTSQLALLLAPDYALNGVVPTPSPSSWYNPIEYVEGPIAVDASGNVYYWDLRDLKHTLEKSSFSLKKGVPVFSASTKVYVSDTSTRGAITADRYGNVYIGVTSSSGTAKILKLSPNGSSYTQNTISTNVVNISAIAADASGNIYISDDANNLVVKLSPLPAAPTPTVISSSVVQPNSYVNSLSCVFGFADSLSNATIHYEFQGAFTSGGGGDLSNPGTLSFNVMTGKNSSLTVWATAPGYSPSASFVMNF